MSKIVRLRARKIEELTQEEYMDYINTIEQHLTTLGELKNVDFDPVRKILKEVRFCAAFNRKFIQETSQALVEICDSLYVAVHDEEHSS